MINNEFTVLSTKSFAEEIRKYNNDNNNSYIKTISNIDSIDQKIDYLICFGGDGTILEAGIICEKITIKPIKESGESLLYFTLSSTGDDFQLILIFIDLVIDGV